MWLSTRKQLRITFLSVFVWVNAVLLLNLAILFFGSFASFFEPLIGLAALVAIGLSPVSLYLSAWAVHCTICYRRNAWIGFLFEMGGPAALGTGLLLGYYQQWDLGPTIGAFLILGTISIAIGAFIGITVGLGARFELTHADSHLCRRCGYDIRFLSEPRCPECGTAFDPAQHHYLETERTSDAAPGNP